MKERPILFSASMVRAILAGSKTQTRRIVKPQPLSDFIDPEIFDREFEHHGGAPLDRACAEWSGSGEHRGTRFRATLPYGKPGDRLWVRENGWERPERTPKMMREGADTWAAYYYDADPWSAQDFADFKAWEFKRRPSIHMPRWASRILLEVTDVRVERLQNISIADSIAEGVEEAAPHLRGLGPCMEWRYSYEDLWKAINGTGSWDANPWVWVIEFNRIDTAAHKGEGR